MKSVLLAIALVAAGSVAASAYDRRGSAFENWQTRQMQRIEAGRKTGAITWSEGNTLRAEQRAILAKRQQLMADGYLSRGERRTLRDMMENADDHIEARIADGHRRAWFLPRVGR